MGIIETIWSDGWYLEVLYPEMVQLSLELFARYGRTICSLAKESATSPGAGDWDAAATPPSWATNSVPIRFARASADVHEILTKVCDAENGQLANRISQRLPNNASEKA